MRRTEFREVALSLTEPGTILHDDSSSRDCNRRNPHHPHLSSTSLSSTTPTPVETAAAAFALSGRKPVAEHRTLKQQYQQLEPKQQLQPLQQHHQPPSTAHRHQLVRQLSRHTVQTSPQGSSSSSAVLRQQQHHHHPRHLPKLQPISRSSSTTSTLHDTETDSADYESTPVEDKHGRRATTSTSSVVRIVTSVRRKAKTVGRTVAAISRSALSSGRSSSENSASSTAVQKANLQVRPPHSDPMEDIGVEQRIDLWQSGLKAALDRDIHGQQEDALEAYDRLNRNITKGAIYDYEQLSCDQKKLLSQVLTCLDMRTQQLRITLEGSRAQINKPGLASTGPLSKGSITAAAEAMALEELTKCSEVLDTIRRMGSKAKVPVVLVYRERKPRTHHRHEEKGQSNKVIFAKEKRDFLSLMGLPGSMFSEKGFDFTVRPNTATAIRKMQEEAKNNNDNKTEDTTEVGEIEPDEKNGGATVQTDEDTTDSPKSGKKNLLNYLPFMKKAAVSPQPGDEEQEEEEEEAEGEATEGEEEAADARSTLSCDTCSSAGSSDTEEEFDDGTDMAVTSATYAHRENIQPPPFRELGSTYVTLDLEKLGVKNTTRIVCPFVRVSVRDSQGNLATPGFPQETAEWEVINKNSLKAPSQIHLQQPLDALPEDVAIFLELRHYRPQKNIISTICYAFLERKHLSDGRFICELYSPPVDFTKKNLKTYTEKAFFLHLEVVLKQATCDVQTLESPKSTSSS